LVLRNKGDECIQSTDKGEHGQVVVPKLNLAKIPKKKGKYVPKVKNDVQSHHSDSMDSGTYK